MPRIPLVQAQVSNVTGLPDTQASPDAFGAGAGRALQGLGSEISRSSQEIGGAVNHLLKQQREENIANKVANFDYVKRNLDRVASAPRDGSGLYQGTAPDYQESVNTYVNDITDPEVRTKTRDELLRRQEQFVAQNAGQEMQLRTNAALDDANSGLTTAQNKVRSDPSQYDTAVTDAANVINARPSIPASMKAAMIEKSNQQIAKARFDGLFENAKTPTDLNAIEGELKDKTWQGKLAANDYDHLNDSIKTTRTAMLSKANAQISAGITTLRERSKDPTALIPETDMADVAAQLKSAGTPSQMREFSEILATQNGYRLAAKLPPSAVENLIQTARAGGSPSDFANRIAGVEGGSNPAAKNPNSTATGAGQFIDGTWLHLMKTYHPDIVGSKSDGEVLALRNDPKLSRQAITDYANENAGILKAAGLPATEGTLSLAHFAGAAGAVSVLRAAAQDPNRPVTDDMLVNKGSLAANKFLQGMTAGQLVKWANDRVGGGTNVVDSAAFVKSQSYKDVQKAQQQTKTDMMTYGSAPNVNVVPPLGPLNTPDDFARRGVDALKVADYFEVPRESATPLTPGEVDKMTQTVKNGTAEEQINLLQSMQAMGPQMYAAAAKQIGASDPTFAHAAALAAQPEQAGVAADIIRGRKQLQENKLSSQMLGSEKQDGTGAFNTFNSVVGNSLWNLKPADQAAVKESADAYYVQKYGAPGKQFDANNYTSAVNAVLAKGIGTVNGQATLLPPGVDENTMNTAIAKLTDTDLRLLSATGDTPVYASGEPVHAEDIRDEGTFRAIGGGQYSVLMADGRPVLTNRADPNQPSARLPYLMLPKAAQLRDIASRIGTQLQPALLTGP